MDALSKQQIAQLAGKAPAQWLRIERGYTPAERWRVTFEDGSTAFAKIGSTRSTAQWLRAEQAVYSAVSGPFMPRHLGFSDHPERPLLLLEDLSHAVWPPPWGPGDVQRLLETLRVVAATPVAPGAIPELEGERGRLAGWLNVERDPAPFLSLGLCSEGWLANALPSLLLAQDLAWLGGTELVHGDLRSDNLCLLPERVVLVDWNSARLGSAALDLAFLAPSLRLEGGPLPDELLPGEAPLAALVCGFFAANAGLRPIPDAPRVRRIQLRRLRIALPWAARAVGLPAPDGAWAARALAELDAALEAGQIEESRWSAASEEVIGDAWLASDEPGAFPGETDEDVDVRCALILDALPARPGAFSVLDVGSGNGHRLARLVRSGKERGLAIEPYGIERSQRLVTLAQSRWPAWSDRFELGDVLEQAPARRYDLVHAALDWVPKRRRRRCLERLVSEFLKPGGRVVLCSERIRRDGVDPRERLEALGLRAGGVVEQRHPVSGELQRCAWLAAQ